MLRARNPEGIAPPVGAYSHCVEIPANSRLLTIAGQVGITPDGTLAEGFEAQHDQIWKNVLAILRSSGMGPENLVHLNVYSTDLAGIKYLAIHRKQYLDPDHTPTSTWVVVRNLARPDWLVEMDALAAQPA